MLDSCWNPGIMLNLQRTKGRMTYKGIKQGHRTKVSSKTGRKRSEGRKEGAKEGRISDIKVSIVVALLSPFVCLSSFPLQGSVVLQMVLNICFFVKLCTGLYV